MAVRVVDGQVAVVISAAVLGVDADVVIRVLFVFQERDVAVDGDLRVVAAESVSLYFDVQGDTPEVGGFREPPQVEILCEKPAVECFLLAVQAQVQVGTEYAR